MLLWSESKALYVTLYNIWRRLKNTSEVSQKSRWRLIPGNLFWWRVQCEDAALLVWPDWPIRSQQWQEGGGSFPRSRLFNLKNNYDVTVMKHMVRIYKQRVRQYVKWRTFLLKCLIFWAYGLLWVCFVTVLEFFLWEGQAVSYNQEFIQQSVAWVTYYLFPVWSKHSPATAAAWFSCFCGQCTP